MNSKIPEDAARTRISGEEHKEDGLLLLRYLLSSSSGLRMNSAPLRRGYGYHRKQVLTLPAMCGNCGFCAFRTNNGKVLTLEKPGKSKEAFGKCY